VGRQYLTNSFDSLGLSDKVTEAVKSAGYAEPTQIQAEAIPHVLERKDIIGIAQTGTGKTASFVLPMLTLLEKGRARARMPRTLILEPTRELASQVYDNFVKYGANHRLSVALLIGGVSFDEQNKILDRGADVLIATPGRLLDHFERGRLLMTGVEILVIDEADRMLDMGFIPDIERICGLLPPRRQTLFFSATMPDEIKRLTTKFLRDPVRVEVARQNATADTITQSLVKSGSKPHEKRQTLRDQIDASDKLTNAIVFCNRKRDVATVVRSLARHGYNAGALHGDMDQRSRTETLQTFRNGDLKILVASDVAARGLDIPEVSHVFNFDVPTHAEDYVHRIGRTGRAGRSGTAVTIATSADSKYVDAIEKMIGRSIDQQKADGKGSDEKRQDTGEQNDTAKSGKPDNSAAEGKSGGGRGRRRSRGKNKNGADTEKQTAPQQAVEPPRSGEPAPETEQTETANAGKEKSSGDKRSGKQSDPFGDNGPVPAFLLRSFAKT